VTVTLDRRMPAHIVGRSSACGGTRNAHALPKLQPARARISPSSKKQYYPPYHSSARYLASVSNLRLRIVGPAIFGATNLGSKRCWSKHIQLSRNAPLLLAPQLPYPFRSGGSKSVSSPCDREHSDLKGLAAAVVASSLDGCEPIVPVHRRKSRLPRYAHIRPWQVVERGILEARRWWVVRLQPPAVSLKGE
jgi:hypothetical protein